MRVYPFPYCCGAFNAVGFPEDVEEWMTVEEKNRVQSRVCRSLDGKIKYYDLQAAFMLAILADYQKPFFEDILLERKFKPLLTHMNPNSENEITLYARSMWDEKRAFEQAMKEEEDRW